MRRRLLPIAVSLFYYRGPLTRNGVKFSSRSRVPTLKWEI